MMVGTTNTGKTTLALLILKILDQYGCVPSTDILFSNTRLPPSKGQGATPFTEELLNKRAGIITELGQGLHLLDDLWLKLSGGDPIKSRGLWSQTAGADIECRFEAR